MVNERLRDAVLRSGRHSDDLAAAVGVDPKTVQRWITRDRIPYARYRHQVSQLLGESETWLWPDAVSQEHRDAASRSELVQIYARRSELGPQDFRRLVVGADTFIDFMFYAALWLPEQLPQLPGVLAEKGAGGTRVRLLLGDPRSPGVAQRGVEEGIGEDTIGTKIRNALALLEKSLRKARGVDVRLHGTTLYTSIYRGDDEMFANPHVLGLPAAQSPVLHLRRLAAGGLFDTYSAMYDRVWESAKPAWS